MGSIRISTRGLYAPYRLLQVYGFTRLTGFHGALDKGFWWLCNVVCCFGGFTFSGSEGSGCRLVEFRVCAFRA